MNPALLERYAQSDIGKELCERPRCIVFPGAPEYLSQAFFAGNWTGEAVVQEWFRTDFGGHSW
mgnify:CR=1 FL=1